MILFKFAEVVVVFEEVKEALWLSELALCKLSRAFLPKHMFKSCTWMCFSMSVRLVEIPVYIFLQTLPHRVFFAEYFEMHTHKRVSHEGQICLWIVSNTPQVS